MSIKISLAGAMGRMGGLILEEIGRNEDVELVSALDLVGVGKPAFGSVIVSDASEIRTVLEDTRPDVLIDFTTPSATAANVSAGADLGVDLVVGTTGFTDGQRAMMETAIRQGGVSAVISPNFSVGVNLFWKLAEASARALRDYDVEVIEAHHNQKKDAPSGTATRTVEVLKDAMEIDDVVHGRFGISEGPRPRVIGVHAVRAGDIVGDHTVLFAGPGERIEIRHQAHSRAAFARGAVRAARWVAGAPPGIYDMADVLKDGDLGRR